MQQNIRDQKGWGTMIKKAILQAGFILATVGLLSGCTTQAERLVKHTKAYGDNPYITAPHIKDLELRMKKIVLAENSTGPEYAKKFNPHNKAILDNFKSSYDHADLMAKIALSRLDFDTAVASTYPVIGNETDCAISDNDGYFHNTNDEPTRFDWQFVQGSCENGLAQGIAKLRADQSDARFVGEFDQGKMVTGLFTMMREDGRRVTQIGDVPNKNHTARTLFTETKPNGYQWHLYGDFNDQGDFDGFGLNIWGYTNLLQVKNVGEFQAGTRNGLAAYQKDDDYNHPLVWLGFYKNDRLNNWGAFTDSNSGLYVGEWKDGSLHGVVYRSRVDMLGHLYDVGQYIDGKAEGPFKTTWYNLYGGSGKAILAYKDGSRTYEEKENIDPGKIIALTAGAMAIGASGADTNTMVDVGSAFAADVIGDTGGTNLQNLQSAYNARNANAQSSGTGNGETGNGTNATPVTKLNEFNTTITCPDTGVTSDITIPYRTEACRVAAIDFAKTFSCNLTDQDRVTQNCQTACGDPRCLEK